MFFEVRGWGSPRSGVWGSRFWVSRFSAHQTQPFRVGLALRLLGESDIPSIDGSVVSAQPIGSRYCLERASRGKPFDLTSSNIYSHIALPIVPNDCPLSRVLSECLCNMDIHSLWVVSSFCGGWFFPFDFFHGVPFVLIPYTSPTLSGWAGVAITR